MIYSGYLNIINEHYDLSDPYTASKVLVNTEAEQKNVITNLVTRLYEKIKQKVDEIDFGTIPKSKGNITKIDGYQNLIECINIIHDLIKEYGESTEPVDQISTAIDNIQTRTRVWEKAFAMNIEIPKMTYNTMVLGVVSSVSLLINTCIEYVKNPNETITTALDKASYIKQREHVLFVSLRDFNLSCHKGDMDKICETSIRMNARAIKEAYEKGYDITNISESDMNTFMLNVLREEGVILEDIASTTRNILGVITALITLQGAAVYILKGFRRIVWWFMGMNQKVSDYFAEQADFLQINAENLKYRDNMDESTRKKVYARQMKWVERFRKWSNAFMIKDKKAQNETNREEQDDKNQRYPDNQDTNDDDGGIF